MHEWPRLRVVQHAHLRVDVQLVKMVLHQLQTKTVQRGNVRGVEERDLFLQRFFGWTNASPLGCLRTRLMKFVPPTLQRLAQTHAHFRRRRLGEGHHQDIFQ